MRVEENSFERPLEEGNRLLSWQKWDSLTIFQCDVLKSRKQWRVLEREITGPLIKINEVNGRISCTEDFWKREKCFDQIMIINERFVFSLHQGNIKGYNDSLYTRKNTLNSMQDMYV